MTSDPSQVEDSTAKGDPLPPSGKNKSELVSNCCGIIKIICFSLF